MTRRARAAGVILLAGSWGFNDGFYVRPIPGLFWGLIVTGVLCLAAGSLRGRSAREAIVTGAATGASVLALQLGLQMILPTLMSHAHRITGGAEAAASLLRVVSIETGVDQESNLILQTEAGPRAVAISWELLSLPMGLRVLVGLVMVMGTGLLPRYGLALLAYTAARLLVVAVLIASGAGPLLGYSPGACLLSFLPLVLFLPGEAVPATPDLGKSPGEALRRGVALLILGGAGLGLGFGYKDPGHPKPGRVLIDESHSNWEWTHEPFDYGKLGERSVYNYALWRSWIERHYETRVTRVTPTREDLLRTDVLVIKTPTTPYASATIDEVEQFVRGGGGLYLVGDHTNLYGMSTILNAVAAPYRISFNFDDTFPLDHHDADLFIPAALAPHPILRGISRYPFETSCTLDVPWSADHVMVGRRLGAEKVDYGHFNFFGDIRLDASEFFGLFTQAATVRHGKGRVAAFSDSTNFSNFSFLWPGRRELTLNMLDWLNRGNPAGIRGHFGAVALAAGMLASIAGSRASLGTGPVRLAAALWLGVVSFLATAHGASLWSADRLGPRVPGDPLRTVAFEESLGVPRLDPASPVFSRETGSSWDSFNTFFVNAARSGLWPISSGSLTDALDTTDVVVVVNPRRPATETESRAVRRVLEDGGRLLVLDSVLSRDEPGAHLLVPFGLGAERALAPRGGGEGGMALVRRVSRAEGIVRHALPGGGTAVSRNVGAGRVVLVSEAAVFSDAALGGVYSTPDEARRNLYLGQQELFRVLLD